MDDVISTLSLRRVVIFDFDDTLVATTTSRKLLFWRFLQLFVDAPVDSLDQVWGRPMHEMLTRLAPGIDQTRLLEAYAAIMDLTPPAPLLRGAQGAVQCLSAAGISLIILTSGMRRFVVSDLSRHGLLDSFQLIVSTEEVPWAKPDPRTMGPILKWIAEKGHSLNDALFIGDSLTDLECARRTGVDFLAVTTGGTDRATFQSNGCQDTIDSLDMVAEVVCRAAAKTRIRT